MNYCKYFQAQINPQDCWFFVAAIRSFEHLAFDRTFDKATSTFEFLVPVNHTVPFIALMNYFSKKGIVTNFKHDTNRFSEFDL